MRNLIRSFFLIFYLGWASLYASPSEEALNASLEALGSPESYHEIAPLSGLQDRYHTGYVALYKRYRVTQEEYREVEQKFKEAGVPLFFPSSRMRNPSFIRMRTATARQVFGSLPNKAAVISASP